MDRRRAMALLYGLLCHAFFAVAVGWMTVGLHRGLTPGLGGLEGTAAWAANLALALQFALGHSFFLSRPGRRLLWRLAPESLGRDLVTTTYAGVVSLQLLAVFLLWSPSGLVLWDLRGLGGAVLTVLYTGSWLLLLKAMADSGLALQTGYLGWSAVFRRLSPRYPPMPTRGLFRHTRQPIYVAFTLVLWIGPRMTLDRLVLASLWTGYCVLAPHLKEGRYRRLFGEAFERYQARVPYWVPSLRPHLRDPGGPAEGPPEGDPRR